MQACPALFLRHKTAENHFILTGTDIIYAKSLLDAGEVVAIPTETVYGLAGNALMPDAILKIFEAKNRPQFNPLIIHLPIWRAVNEYATNIPAAAHELAMHFSPGPITFLLQKKQIIPDLVTAGSAKVAIRIPAHPLTMQLLKTLNYPVAAPSANPFGYVSPTSAAHVEQGLGNKISYILDGGPCPVGVESTIVDFEGNAVIIRRNGAVSKEMIEEALGQKVLLKTGSTEHPVAPGQLKSHYATETPLLLVEAASDLAGIKVQKMIVLSFGGNTAALNLHNHTNELVQLELSATANLNEAAKNLFAFMRQADAMGADMIITKLLPSEGLGRAINDRLQRARHSMK